MWEQLLNEAGLTEREVRSIMVLGNNPNMRASELAKELQTTSQRSWPYRTRSSLDYGSWK